MSRRSLTGTRCAPCFPGRRSAAMISSRIVTTPHDAATAPLEAAAAVGLRRPSRREGPFCCVSAVARTARSSGRYSRSGTTLAFRASCGARARQRPAGLRVTDPLTARPMRASIPRRCCCRFVCGCCSTSRRPIGAERRGLSSYRSRSVLSTCRPRHDTVRDMTGRTRRRMWVKEPARSERGIHSHGRRPGWRASEGDPRNVQGSPALPVVARLCRGLRPLARAPGTPGDRGPSPMGTQRGVGGAPEAPVSLPRSSGAVADADPTAVSPTDGAGSGHLLKLRGTSGNRTPPAAKARPSSA
jgi:hypothetical protein